MNKYIDVEKLKAEIERLNSLVSYESKDRHDEGLHDAYKAVKNVIASLQQEQQEVDLEKEIEKELRLHYNDDQDVYWWNYLKNSFRHFYELGKNSK